MKPTLLLIALCIIFSISSYSNQTQKENLKIHFLSAEEAGKVLSDTINDNYLLLLSPLEMEFKTGNELNSNNYDDQLIETIKRYKSNTMEFSNKEKTIIKKITNKISPVLQSNYAIFNNYEWRFLKVSNNIEGGIAHTRGNCIVFSESICNHMLQLYKKDKEKALMTLGNLFVHEQLHVIQRDNPDLFDELYTEKWGFIEIKKLENDWLKKHLILNPDAPNWKWVFYLDSANKYICPGIVFKSDTIKNFHNNMRFVAIELTKNNEKFEVKLDSNKMPIMENLYKIKEYNKFFAPSHNHYNPDELTADFFARIFIFDFFTDQAKIPEEKRKKLNAIFDELRPIFKSQLNNI